MGGRAEVPSLPCHTLSTAVGSGRRSLHVAAGTPCTHSQRFGQWWPPLRNPGELVSACLHLCPLHGNCLYPQSTSAGNRIFLPRDRHLSQRLAWSICSNSHTESTRSYFLLSTYYEGSAAWAPRTQGCAPNTEALSPGGRSRQEADVHETPRERAEDPGPLDRAVGAEPAARAAEARNFWERHHVTVPL